MIVYGFASIFLFWLVKFIKTSVKTIEFQDNFEFQSTNPIIFIVFKFSAAGYWIGLKKAAGGVKWIDGTEFNGVQNITIGTTTEGCVKIEKRSG